MSAVGQCRLVISAAGLLTLFMAIMWYGERLDREAADRQLVCRNYYVRPDGSTNCDSVPVSWQERVYAGEAAAAGIVTLVAVARCPARRARVVVRAAA